MRSLLIGVAATLALASTLRADTPVVKTESIEETATIEAIDKTGRTITLKNKDGETETVYAGPQVKRFDELKVGDTVTFQYYESRAVQIRRPGDPAPEKGGSMIKTTPGVGARPGGTVARQHTETVTVKAIDAKTPAVTVVSSKGHVMSYRVEDKENLKKIKVGDTIDVTYTEAVLINVK
jgi:Cu/Ag efflux protein CusF